MYEVGDIVRILLEKEVRVYPRGFPKGNHRSLIQTHGTNPTTILELQNYIDGYSPLKWKRECTLAKLESNETWLVPTFLLSPPIKMQSTYGVDGMPKRKIRMSNDLPR